MKRINDIQEYLKNIPDGDKAYNFLASVNESTKTGSYFINLNMCVKLMPYETKPEEKFDGVFEIHRDNIDVQIILKGHESIFIGDKEGKKVVKEYNEPDDVEFVKCNAFHAERLADMQGVEILVGEPHMGGYVLPEFGPQKILKAVIKIHK